MEMHDAWFFIGVFVFIFLIWVSTGGPLHPIAFTGPRLAQPGELGGGTYLQLPKAPFMIGDSNVSLQGSTNGGRSYSNTSGTDAPLGSSGYGVPSPFRNVVSMSHYVSNASSSNPNTEYVQLSVSQNAGTPIDITGWKLVSEVTGKAAAFPSGTVVPTSGIVNSVQHIILTPGESAFVVSGRSPVGPSFRENKCVGYLSTFQQFTPSLPQNCPLPTDELAAYYGPYPERDVTCVEYVNRLSRCEAVLFPPNTISKACKSFVSQHLNYNGCVSTHRNDADFNGSVWRIYLSQDKHLWRAQREIIKLFDINSKTVDAFSY